MKRPKNLYHISLVGGAFSGKSSCLAYCEKHLAEHFQNSERKVTIFFAQEEATKQIKLNPSIDNTTLHFQFMVLSGQLASFHQASVYAEQHPNEVVFLISDRSALEGRIYLKAEDLDAIGWNYMCDLYDHFFFFDSYLDHCKNLFSLDFASGNVYRKETSAIDLIQLANKTKSFYLGSGMVDPEKITIIRSYNSIVEKQQFVEDLIIKYILKTIKEAII